ncbi:deubiquitinase OTUD6B [Tachysurus ichikawai]
MEEIAEEVLAKQHRKEKKELQGILIRFSILFYSDKKAAQEKERENRIAEAEVENLSGSRYQESLKLTQKLAEKQLQIKEISSDGHCMYRAVEDQLTGRVCSLKIQELRVQTAQYMRSHKDDFLPFLTNPSTGEMYSAEEFEKYCSDVAETAAWGGQLELRALTHVLQLPIEVIQADSPTIVIGEEYDKSPITLVYMRHAYGLGEHYNSVEPQKDAAESLSNLILLNLNHNKIKLIPPAIKSLSNLERFSIADNQLEEIPAEFGLVSKLTEITLSRNKLSEIPQELYKLTHLRKLSLARNSLKQLPEVGSEFHLLELEELYFEGNDLVQLKLFTSSKKDEVLPLKDMGIKNSKNIPVRVLLCSSSCFNNSGHSYYSVAKVKP